MTESSTAIDLPQDILETLNTLAEANNISLQDFLIYLLEMVLSREDKSPSATSKQFPDSRTDNF
jgi:hypothetical protein